MAINIRDEEFERQVEAERQRRGHKTLTKTLRDVAKERFVQLESLRPQLTATGNQPVSANDARNPNAAA
ncbi:MAG TPA: hypothetical protein VGN72_06655 [Tepidisphaeraceae bacterium]|jgi:hypothetical protein|nr:hypothetical protein [Tepidisphaeraceae bacterium]